MKVGSFLAPRGLAWRAQVGNLYKCEDIQSFGPFGYPPQQQGQVAGTSALDPLPYSHDVQLQNTGTDKNLPNEIQDLSGRVQ